MRAFVCFVLLIISNSYANAQKTAVSVYLHPISSFFGILGASPIFLTVEIPFSLSNSLIIKPSLLNISDHSAYIFRLGSDFGFRHHLSGKGEGLYLQGQMGVFYYKRTDFSFIGDKIFSIFFDMPRKSLWLDAMGYVGYSLKFSRVNVFIDAGIGIIMGIDTETGQVKPVTFFDGAGILWPDINFGIGISF
ncbi:MAG: hypothetical protein LBU89_06420 [Fibromonadaceae bacterium]|jgi:hypothetical protein|nr:hypothetical protein [Fibromonadaceae bacterium]